jgi:hypothetical protein
MMSNDPVHGSPPGDWVNGRQPFTLIRPRGKVVS